MDLEEMYYYSNVELTNPISRDWLFVASSYPLMLITFGYLYFVLYAGPRYMKNRLPYKLRNFILIYDMIQILANLWLVKKLISAGWFSELSIICGARRSICPNTIKLFSLMWWFMYLKLFDYIETCVFVLRKKQDQVSVLHVYHHVCNIAFIWFYLKYILDERATIVGLVNCSVHVIMYMYYFMAAWSPGLQQIVLPIKPFITKLQMVQFIVLILLMLQLFNPNCEVSVRIEPVVLASIGNLFIYLYLFYDFYKKSYTKLPKQ